MKLYTYPDNTPPVQSGETMAVSYTKAYDPVTGMFLCEPVGVGADVVTLLPCDYPFPITDGGSYDPRIY